MRKIDSIIIHCTATPARRAVTVDEIRKWHKAAGYNDIGYHYIIDQKGEVLKGRDVSVQGAHAKGHNQTSIGVCYIGGTDEKLTPKDTLNELQKSSLISLIKQLKDAYGSHLTIHGHNEFANKACPSFDVKRFIKDNRL